MSQTPREADESNPEHPASEEELSANTFLASLPWWVVLGRDAAAPDSPGYLVLDADGSTCLAVFTDEDLAQRFVHAAGFEGGPLPVDTPEQFARLRRRLPEICTYAMFDPPAKVGARARWVVPLSDVLRALEEARQRMNQAEADEDNENQDA
jgi:hypothetical protein